MATSSTTALSFGAVLRLRTMRRIWYAQIVSVFGDFLAIFAVISVVSFRLHGTAAQVTWVQIAYLLPFALFGAVAGVFVDRWPLKATMILSDLVRGGLIALLIFATHLWQFYLVLVLLSLVSIFFMPAQSVAIRLSVPREGLLSANSLKQQVFFFMRIAGPAAAGLLVAVRSPYLLRPRRDQLRGICVSNRHRDRGSPQSGGNGQSRNVKFRSSQSVCGTLLWSEFHRAPRRTAVHY